MHFEANRFTLENIPPPPLIDVAYYFVRNSHGLVALQEALCTRIFSLDSIVIRYNLVYG